MGISHLCFSLSFNLTINKTHACTTYSEQLLGQELFKDDIYKLCAHTVTQNPLSTLVSLRRAADLS